MRNFKKQNLGFCTSKIGRNPDYYNYFVTKNITDKSLTSSLDNINIFPLYIYPEEKDHDGLFDDDEPEEARRVPNLKPEIVDEIANRLGLVMMPDHEMDIVQKSDDHRDRFFTPLDLLDYIYGVLHSPTYRKTYQEFLKIDFPRVPYPEDRDTFWSLVELGGELRQIHLLEHHVVNDFINTYSQPGDNHITRRLTKSSIGFEITDKAHGTGRVWINDDQYFDDVPEVAWEFYIGGYQPAQKWLKDRRDRILSYEDIRHYQKIIVALTETDRLMKEIDKIAV